MGNWKEGKEPQKERDSKRSPFRTRRERERQRQRDTVHPVVKETTWSPEKKLYIGKLDIYGDIQFSVTGTSRDPEEMEEDFSSLLGREVKFSRISDAIETLFYRNFRSEDPWTEGPRIDIWFAPLSFREWEIAEKLRDEIRGYACDYDWA